MQPIVLIRVDGHELHALAPGSFTPAQVVHQYLANEQVYLGVRADTGTSTADLIYDFSEMFNAHPALDSAFDWSDVATWVAGLTPVQVPCPTHRESWHLLNTGATRRGGVQEPFGFHRRQSVVRLWSVDHSFLLHGQVVEDETQPPNSVLEFDLGQAPLPPNPNHLIPVIRGLVHRRRIVGDKLQALGAGYALNINTRVNREELLLDFTEVGGCEQVGFVDLDMVQTSGLVEVTVPPDFEPANRAVLIVLGGRILFPGDHGITRPTDDTLLIPTATINTFYGRLNEAHTLGIRVPHSLVLRPAEPVAPIAQLATPTCSLIFLNRPVVYRHLIHEITRVQTEPGPDTVPTPTQLWFAAGAGGILHNTATGRMRDYWSERPSLAGHRLITLAAERPLWTPAHPGPDHSMGICGYLRTRDSFTHYRDPHPGRWVLANYIVPDQEA